MWSPSEAGGPCVTTTAAILVTHDIGEAITMADRILVMTHRPASVLAIHMVGDAGRDPVTMRESPVFQSLFQTIWQQLSAKVAA